MARGEVSSVKRVATLALIMAPLVFFACAAGAQLYEESFDGPNGALPDATWTVTGNPYLNGSGQLVFDEGDGDDTDKIQRTIGDGDFTVNLSFSSVDYGDTTAYPGVWYVIADGGDRFEVKLYEVSDQPHPEDIRLNVKARVNGTWVLDSNQVVGKYDDGFSWDVTVTYAEATKTYAVSSSINGGPAVHVVSPAFNASTAARYEYVEIYNNSDAAAALLDYYNFDISALSDTAITVPAGNKDRGVRLSFKVQGGPLTASLEIPGNGTQEVTTAQIGTTDAGRWSDVVIEADICSDEELLASMTATGGTITDVKLSLIEAAANRHYGDNIRIDYDRGLRLITVPDGEYAVAGVQYDGQTVCDMRAFGEFSAQFDNTTHEFGTAVANWKAQPDSCTLSADGKRLDIAEKLPLKELGGYLDLHMVYEAINNHVIKKSITFRHRRSPELLYSVDCFIGGNQADTFWSWSQWQIAQDGWRVRSEDFPAVGYRKGAVTLGLVPDSGYLNEWNRVSRVWENDPATGNSIGTTPATRLPDHEFLGVFPSQDKAGFRLGKLYYLDLDIVWPCHQLRLGETRTKTFFITVNEGIDDVRELKIAQQTGFAEGKGYQGSVPEKVLYADQEMLTGIFDHITRESYVHPSLGYEMVYKRDAFWQALAMYEEKVSSDVLNLFAGVEGPEGQISGNVRPYSVNSGLPGGHTDANVKHVIWAYVNKVRYDLEYTAEQLERLDLSVQWIRKTFATGAPGVYMTRSAGWFDVFAFAESQEIAHMQGQYMAALKCAKALGVGDVTAEEIALAEQEYRNFYDSELGYMIFARNGYITRSAGPQFVEFERIISPSSLMGEFLNLWLFGKPILSDEAVCNTLDKLDEICERRWADGYALPNVLWIDGTRYTPENKPYAENLYWQPGIYHNGGSWMLYEQQAYTVGHLHGWTPQHVGKSAIHRIAKRMQLEISEKDEPVSHEYLPMTENGINTPGSSWDGRSDDGQPGPPGAKVFGWNSFSRICLEMVGLRPVEDPILKRRIETAAFSLSVR